MKRAQSSDSASTLSNIDVAGPSTRDSLPVSTSSTPPTSVTESATPSEPDAAKDKELLQHRRSGRARTSIASYNDNVLSGTAVHTRKSFLKNTENDEATGSRAISGATLVDDGVDSPSAQLLGAGTKATQSEWMEESGSPSKADRRRSMRLDRLTDAASSAVGALTSATSVLGKRGRDALESAKDKFQDMNRRASMRLREPQPTKESSEERSPAKRVRMFPNLALVEPEKEAEPEKEKVPEKKPRKFWLKQGLYAGQVRETHPRQKSNKRQSSGETAGKERIYLPLPMFLGEKLLEAGRDFKLPYEILNALPRDQAPKDWRVLSKNRFIGDAAATWKKHNLPMSTCLCTAEKGCDEDCLNRNMQYECNESNCDLGEGCSNRPFGELKWRSKNKNATRNPTKRESNLWGEGVEVAKTADRGYGVRSMRSFNPGQVIVEYAGEIITQDEADRRMNEDYKGKTDFYLMTFHDGMIIDATRGSICRFVNHSCSPNCRVEKWVVAGEPRMALFAGEDGIVTGEELTYDYNFDPFSKKNIQKCLCGAENCRGVLGPKTSGDASKLQRAASTASNLVKSAKRKLKQVIGDGDDESSPKKKRRKTLPDATRLLTKAKKQISKTPAPAVEPGASKMDLEIQKQSRTERAMKRSSSLVTLRSKAGRTLTSRQSTSTYSLASLQSSPKGLVRNKRHSMPLGRALSKGKSLASGSKADLKSLAGGLIKKGSAAAGSVKKTYGNRRSLLGLPSSSKSASRSSSASKLLGSNASLRQSKISFGGGRLSLQEPEPTTPVEQGTPVRSSKRTPKPSPKMIEIGKLAKAKASSARARTSVTPVRSAKRTPKPSPKGLARSRKPATPEMRLLKRTPKPSPKAKENELFANKLKAVVRPGSSSSSSSSRPLTDRSSSKKSMTKGLKSAAAKGVNGSKLAAAKMRMSMKGEEGVRKMVRKVSGAA